ncbi:hypothetical protein RRG08_050099 [Elysia crispata]|uniref:Uncharacterized protein n=1 Tax=Elysia crispata TaxID=231223 RepID=A0AAE1DAL0_9GAST|nr:hypothetical protein RRG08_050099 [Elysia crispata]
MRLTIRLLKQVSKAKIAPQLGQWLDYYSQFHPSPVSIKQFADFVKKKLKVQESIPSQRHVSCCSFTVSTQSRVKVYNRLASFLHEGRIIPLTGLVFPSEPR